MHFYRLLRDEQTLRDVAIPISSCEVPKYLHLTMSQDLISDMLGKSGRDLRGMRFLPE